MKNIHWYRKDYCKSANLKNNFCSSVFRLSVLPWCRERPQTAICCLEWLGRFKCLVTGSDVSLLSFSTSQSCSRNQLPSRLPVSPTYNILQRVQVIQKMTLAEVQVKWSVVLMDHIFWMLQMKGHVLQCVCAFKSSWLITCLECTSD